MCLSFFHENTNFNLRLSTSMVSLSYGYFFLKKRKRNKINNACKFVSYQWQDVLVQCFF